jgi:tetratricopeptide (TPR) repeat protein
LREGGNRESELRFLARHRTLLPQRYYELLADVDPDRLLALAGSARADDGAGDEAVQALLNAGDTARTLAAIEARAAGRAPVWKDAYTGLAGIYFGIDDAVRASLGRALGSMTIGDRIGKPVDRSREIAGDLWFYYGERYGEYLTSIKQDEGYGFIVSGVEESPGDIAAYRRLAQGYRAAGNPAQAAKAYRLALHLEPARIDIEGEEGEALWEAGDTRAALDLWKKAIALGRRQIEDPVTREGAAGRAASLIRSIRARNQRAALEGEIEELLKSALPRVSIGSGIPLLMAAFEDASDLARFRTTLEPLRDAPVADPAPDAAAATSGPAPATDAARYSR